MAGRTRYRWVVFGVLVSAYFFVFVQRVAPNVLAPDLAAAFGLRAGELGLLGSVYFWLYALLQPPLGFLFDRYGVRRLAAASLALAALGSAVLGLAPAFGLALLGRALLGVGTAPFYLGLNLTIRSWFPRAQFATLAGLMQTIGNLGSLAATQPLALAAGALGWREVTVALGALMLGMAGLVYLLVRDRPEEVGLPVPAALVPDVAERPPLGLALRLTLAQRNVLLLGLMYFLLFGVAVAFQGLWAVPFLIDARGLDRATAAGLMAFWAWG
jgi:sugar phosphate permease